MSSDAPWKTGAVEAEVVDTTEVTVTGSDLVPVEREPSAIASPGQPHYSSSRENLREEDILIPRLRLAQGQTPEVLSREAQPGQWVLLGNETTDEVEIVVLSMARVRELRQPGQGEDGGKILCHAPDAYVGIGNPGGECERCPLAEWSEGTTSKERQPKCAEIYRYRVYSITHNALALLQFQRTSINVAKMINTFIKQRDFGAFTVKLGSQKREAGEGRQKFTFYVPTAVARPIDAETQAMVSMFLG